jgi:hypothetical protein
MIIHQTAPHGNKVLGAAPATGTWAAGEEPATAVGDGATTTLGDGTGKDGPEATAGEDGPAATAASKKLEFPLPRWQQPRVNQGQREIGQQHQNLHNLYLQQPVN